MHLAIFIKKNHVNLLSQIERSSSGAASSADKSPDLSSPPPSLDTPELANNDDNDGGVGKSGSTKISPLVGTSKESPLSVASSSSPDVSDLSYHSASSSVKSNFHYTKISEGSSISVVSSSPNTSKLSCTSTSSSVKSSTHSGTSKDSPISVTSTSTCSSARSSTRTGTSKDSPISVASTRGSPDCNDYPTTSNSTSPDSESSSNSGVDTSACSKTASSFHVPEPPEDVSVLFVDEASDYQESSDTEQQSLIKDRQLSTSVEEMRRSMAGLKFTNSPVLRSPDDLKQERRNEEERGSPYEEAKSDSFSSPSSEANPTPLYSHSSGEGESERSTSLSKSKLEGDPEKRVGGGGSDGPGGAGVAQGNGSSSEAGKEKEKERKEKEEEEEDERSAKPEPQFKVGHQYRTVERQLMQNEVSCTYLIVNPRHMRRRDTVVIPCVCLLTL